MRTGTVRFDMAGAGMASVIKLTDWGETGCLLAQVLGNSRLGLSAHLDLVLAARGEGQISHKYYRLEGWSEHGCASRKTSLLCLGLWYGVSTNGRGSLLYSLHPASLVHILDSHPLWS